MYTLYFFCAARQAMSRAFGAFRAANMGEQEDAQEFLAFFLDQLHEEIVDAKKKSPGLSFSSGGCVGGGDGSSLDSGAGRSNGGEGGGGSNGQEDAWLEVGKGGAKAVVNAPDPRKKDCNSSVVRFYFCLFFWCWITACHMYDITQFMFCSLTYRRLSSIYFLVRGAFCAVAAAV